MNDSTLRDELLREGDSQANPEQVAVAARQAVHRARRRTHLLAVATIVLWLLTAAAVITWALGYAVFFIPWVTDYAGSVAFRAEVGRPEQSTSAASTNPATTPAQDHHHVVSPEARRRGAAQAVQVMGLYLLYGAVILGSLVALSAISTVGFVYASRQATLKQLQASLDEIVRELRRG